MTQNAKQYTIAVIPGDGIGKEVTPWAQQALEKATEGVATFEYEPFDLGAERYLREAEARWNTLCGQPAVSSEVPKNTMQAMGGMS
mgnify:CR=1 FL=1